MANKTFAARVRALWHLSDEAAAKRLGVWPSYIRLIRSRKAKMGRPVKPETLAKARRLLAANDIAAK